MSMTITPLELAELRAAQAEALPEVAGVVHDKATVKDATGGTRTTWVPRPPPSLPYRLGNPTDHEARAFADQLRGKATFVLTLPALTPLKDGDRFAGGGRTYNVLAVLAPKSWETARRVLVEQI